MNVLLFCPVLVNAGILSQQKDGKEVYYLDDELIRILES